MAEVKIDNTAEAWGAHLLALAQEAAADAGYVGAELQLHHVLKDLTTVLTAYAARLGVEKGVARDYEPAAEEAKLAAKQEAATVAAEPSVLEAAPVEVSALTPADLVPAIYPPEPVDLSVVHARLDALEQAPGYDLPGWVRDTLQSHHERISALEARLADALDLVETLQRTQQRDTIVIPDALTPDATLTLEDLSPMAWGSIERARQALSARVRRKHQELTTIRQSVLNAVSGLAAVTERSDDESAQLIQERARAERLEMVDVIRDRKLDEVAGLDDLELARLYDVEEGWPK